MSQLLAHQSSSLSNWGTWADNHASTMRYAENATASYHYNSTPLRPELGLRLFEEGADPCFQRVCASEDNNLPQDEIVAPGGDRQHRTNLARTTRPKAANPEK